jgi:hypothetical protein
MEIHSLASRCCTKAEARKEEKVPKREECAKFPFAPERNEKVARCSSDLLREAQFIEAKAMAKVPVTSEQISFFSDSHRLSRRKEENENYFNNSFN